MNGTRQLRQLEEKIRKEKNNILKYVSLQRLADASREEGELEYALLLYTDVLSITQKIRDAKLECETLIDLGSTADDLGKSDDAIKYYERALKIARRIRDFNMQSRIHAKLSMFFAEEGSSSLANEHFTQAKDTARIAKRTTIRINEEVTSTNAIITLNERDRRRLTPPSERQSFKTVSDQINRSNRRRIAEQGLIFLISIICIVVLFILGRDILSLSPIYLLAGVAIFGLLIILNYRVYRSK